MNRLFTRSFRFVWHCAVSLVIFFAILVGIASAVTPYVKEYRPQIERLVSHYINRPVSIGQIKASWHWFEPLIQLETVSVEYQSPSNQVFQAKQANLHIDLLASLRQLRLIPSKISVKGAKLVVNKKQQAAVSFSGDLQLQQRSALWQGRAEHIQMTIEGKTWPKSNIHFKVDLSAEQPRVELSVNTIHITPVIQLLKQFEILDEADTALLKALKPSGVLSPLNLSYQAKNQWKVQTSLHKLSSQAFQRYPGVNNLSGQLVLQPNAGQFELDSRDATITSALLFAKPIRWQQLRGLFHWKNEGDIWQIKAEKGLVKNQDLETQFEFSYQTNDLSRPGKLSLLAGLKIHSVQHIKDYLSKQSLDPKLYRWLQTAIQGQANARGTMILRGDLTKFPFKKNEGLFLTDLNIHDADIRYHPKWPPLKNTFGELVFRNNTMEAQIFRAKVSGVAVNDFTLNIANMQRFKKVLQISGQTNTLAEQAMHFVNESPLRETLSQLKKIQLSGPINLKLNLTIPLVKEIKNTLQGKLKFNKARLRLPDWKILLKKVDGTIQFTEQGLKSGPLTATLMESPFQFNVETIIQKNKQKATKIDMVGKLSTDSLKQRFKFPILKALQGQLVYKGNILIPSDERESIQLYISSPLKGIASLLPAPLLKTSDAKAQLAVTANFFPNRAAWLRIAVENHLSAILHVNPKHQIDKGELVLGQERAQMPKDKGLYIKGELKQTSLSELRQDLFMPGSTEKRLFPSIKKIDLRFTDFKMFGQRYEKLHLISHIQPESWLLKLSGDKLQGQIQLPFDKSQAIMANFDKLYLDKLDSDNKFKLLPKQVPKLNLAVKDFRYHNNALGNLELVTVPTDDDCEIRAFNLRSKFMTLSAQGLWQSQNGRLQTILLGEASLHPLQKTLQTWKLKIPIEAKKSYFNFSLRWPGAPHQMQLTRADGTMNINLEDGLLTHLSEETERKIGLGKLIGLLSLQSLPRRLLLDFKDLKSKGLPFDRWRNDLVLKNGLITLQKSKIEGPIALAQISGKMDVANKQYDLKVYVIPNLTASLPVIATLAGGPIAGAATWVANSLVGPEVHKAAAKLYKVTGDWDKPIIKKLAIA